MVKEGNGNPLQYSCLENPMYGGAWKAAVHGSLRVGHDWNDLAGAAAQMLSHVWLFVILWTVVCQAPLSIGFSRPDYWNELPFLPPGDLIDPGIKHMSLISPPLAGGFFISESYGKPIYISDPNIYIYMYIYGLYLKSLCYTSETLWNYMSILIIVIIIKSTKNVHFTNLSPLWFLFTFVENLVTIEWETNKIIYLIFTV